MEDRYRQLVKAFAGRPGVSVEGSGFGSDALKVSGRIFAMLDSKRQFVVKLPKKRVDELVQAGEGTNFDAGKGRPMKEWLALSEESTQDWADLAAEAMSFVATKT